jgi:eukaryotic-like serine/threonine-protein kinase
VQTASKLRAPRLQPVSGVSERATMVAMDSKGRYRLIRRLGAGSFATVWLGHDDDLDVPVAVKVLADNWANNSDARNRFLTEARILRRIHDRRLVQVYDIGRVDDGRP